jgi:uncharacterized membrane protein
MTSSSLEATRAAGFSLEPKTPEASTTCRGLELPTLAATVSRHTPCVAVKAFVLLAAPLVAVVVIVVADLAN